MSDTLTENIRDGTFPESDDVLGKEVDSKNISLLLSGLATSKTELEDEIRQISQSEAGDVSGWILQAKRLQEDIARCKIEARHIIEEHERGESLRSTTTDSANKVRLLESEISFNRALEHDIESISEISQVLVEVGHDLSANNPVSAVGKLVSIEATINSISAGQTQTLLSQSDIELRNKCRSQLEQLLSSRWTTRNLEGAIMLVGQSDATVERALGTGKSFMTIDEILTALQDLEALPSATTFFLRTIDSFIFSALSIKSAPYVSSVDEQADSLVITRTDHVAVPIRALTVVQKILQFLYERLPERIRNSVVQELVPKLIMRLTSTWLDLALPHDLDDLEQLEPLQNEVDAISSMLQRYAWPGHVTLGEWVDQIPRGWLAKRRVASLDAVRKAFSSAHGILRPVERVERQKVVIENQKADQRAEDDDWNANWDDDAENPEPTTKQTMDEDDASGWDFDTEDDHPEHSEKELAENGNDEDDVGDAWGWADDEKSKEEPQASRPLPGSENVKSNGESVSAPQAEEMVLKETYHISDIPDYILEIIGKDMADAQELQSSASKHFGTSSPATGLAGLPNLVLALFRATALTYYSLPSANYTLSNINLYNDTLYIVQRLTEIPEASSLQPSIQSLTKFARQVYTAELDIQRTILTDLLDGAQGFDRCTTFPNSQACIDAVSSTVDRVRYLHKEWSSVLGESHLLQSLGSLMTMIFGKIIKDLEDMDDISEAQSEQLVKFCQQILNLEDLFVSGLPDLTGPSQAVPQPEHDEFPPSKILLYVPNYLRFQYLQQILESNLVDIRFLWTEGELSLEFSADEAVDLIKALFAESQHRRDAIRDIRRERPTT